MIADLLFSSSSSSGFTTVVSNLLSFIGGFVTCYALTRIGLFAVSRHPSESTKESAMDAKPRTTKMVLQRHSTIALICVVVGLLVFGVGVRVGYTLMERKVECFDEYASDLADALDSRVAVSERLNNEEANVFLKTARFLQPPPDDLTQEQIERRYEKRGAHLQEALEQYLEANRALAEQRRTEPYPEPPRRVCGDD